MEVAKKRGAAAASRALDREQRLRVDFEMALGLGCDIGRGQGRVDARSLAQQQTARFFRRRGSSVGWSSPALKASGAGTSAGASVATEVVV